jgi:hypothetical protein
MNTKLRVGFLMGQSEHDTLRRQTRALATQFDRAGHESEIFDLLAPSELQRFGDALSRQEFGLVVGFQAWGLNLFDSGPNIFDRAHVPYVAILADHPAYHMSRLRFASSNTAFLVQDGTHIDYIRARINEPAPVAVFRKADTYDATTRTRLSRRPVELLLMASCANPDAIASDLLDRSRFAHGIVLAGLELRTSSSSLDSRGAVHKVLSSKGIDPRALRPSQLTFLEEELDRIERATRRIATVRAIRRAPLTIWGNGWPRELNLPDHIRVQRDGFPTGLEAACRARLMLNIFPGPNSGFHDRCALGAEAGTALLSEWTAPFDHWFAMRGGAVCYTRPSDIDSLAEQLLSNEAQLEWHVARADEILRDTPRDISITTILELRDAILIRGALATL